MTSMVSYLHGFYVIVLVYNNNYKYNNKYNNNIVLINGELLTNCYLTY